MAVQQVIFPNPLPVFVYGALRSGTTVFRLMLDSHGEIGNPGERDFLFDYLAPDTSHPTGWRYDLTKLRIDRIFQNSGLDIPTDAAGKSQDGLDLLAAFLTQLRDESGDDRVFTLNIHRHIDRLLIILPKAKVIHMLRDPRDVARSSIGMGWVTHIYHGVNHWIATEEDWDRVARSIAPDQVLTLTYEGLFRDIETELRRVCDFVGVEWSDAMLSYHETSTYAPPDPSLVEQWRRKCHPDHLALLEGKAGVLMKARSYALYGSGRRPGVIERITLWGSRKFGSWRHGIKIYGMSMFIEEKLTRWLGFSVAHSKVRDRMSAIDRMRIKY